MIKVEVLALVPLLLAAGCADRDQAEAKALIATHCARCHTVPGVPAAVGKIGPSLAGIANRPMIAGQFTNNRPTMARWLTSPRHMLGDDPAHRENCSALIGKSAAAGHNPPSLVSSSMLRPLPKHGLASSVIARA
jgi:hypothetical protein